MAYDEDLAQRIRKVLSRRKRISERRMFGGLAFLLHGNMFCGVIDTDLVLRLGSGGTRQALTEPHTREMDFTGKPLRTMIYVAREGYDRDEDLKRWVQKATRFAATLPPKEAKVRLARSTNRGKRS